MDKPLSISGFKKYMSCPKSYDYHYNENYRPGKTTSALAVGTITGDLIESILKGESPNIRESIDKSVAEQSNIDVEFYDHDFDADTVDIQAIETAAKSMGWKGDDVAEAIKSFLKTQDTLSKNQAELLKIACWQSLSFKMECMVDSFVKWVLPKIAEVHDVQKHLVDENAGYPVHGFLDFTCTLKDGRRVLFDIKTSKMPYHREAVLRSPQLALYSHIEKYDYAGYIVLCKILNKNKIKTCDRCDVKIEGGNTKNCPKCKEKMDVVSNPTSFSQVLIEKMPERNKQLTMEAMSDTIKAIKAGHFPRNLDTCFYMYGRPCPYIDRCWKDKK